MLEQLRNFDAKRLDLEELVELSAIGTTIKNEFDRVTVETPEWLDANLKSLRREIKARQADQIEAALREKRLQVERMTPVEERRKKAQEELAELERKAALHA